MNAQDLLAKAKQYPIAVGGGLVCLVIIAFLYFTSSTPGELEVKYSEVEREVETIKQNETQSKDLEANVQQATKMVEEIDSRLILASNKTGHKRYFQGLVEQSGVKMSKDPYLNRTLNPGEKGVQMSTTEFAQVEYNLEVSGEFQKVMDFLYLLRTGEHFIVESRLLLSSNPQIAQDLVTAEISVSVLAEKKPEEVKKDG
ncbi:hypothetical protein [Rubellicoccus peritrichatus]|uniref:Uncharacterized protein n=1 Tax=Rubellicoccus peritrichatus TaxID=3080537 RepID=A0AAQ3QRJ5_9BACT|nr:hypothetical protein [Puniceicoccus sp. CR14]WOO41408.1 hypothetical protein RZN69_22540 [Puniceicoccus sp. CR14]